MIKDNSRVIKFMYILFILLAIVFFSSCALLRNNKIIKTINSFIRQDIKILYISNVDKYKSYSIEIFEKYDINYLYIDSNNLSEIEKISLSKFINKDELTNIVVLYKAGKNIDSICFSKESELNEFLKKYDLIPEVIGDNSNIINQVSESIKVDNLILYLPYTMSSEIEKQDLLLKKLAEKYSINYKKVDAYLLSNVQKDKLNSLLEISLVEDQIILFIKDESIIGSIRGNITEDEILNKISDIKFVDDRTKLTSIDYEEFERILNNSNKSIVTIVKDDCKYCDDLINVFNNILNSYNININYINIQNEETELSRKVDEYLNTLNYDDTFTLPITLIIEKNKVIDYIIGCSSVNYFVDIFTENGIINTEVR